MLRGKWSDCGRRECIDSDLLIEEEELLKAEIVEGGALKGIPGSYGMKEVKGCFGGQR